MTNRDWFGLALRLFGIWLLLYSIESIVPSLIMVIFMSPGMGPGPSYAFVLGFWFIGRTAVALVLVVFAPAIASRFYPEVPSQEPGAPGSGVKPLRVGLQLLGMCAVLLAIQSVGDGHHPSSGERGRQFRFGRRLLVTGTSLISRA